MRLKEYLFNNLNLKKIMRKLFKRLKKKANNDVKFKYLKRISNLTFFLVIKK